MCDKRFDFFFIYRNLNIKWHYFKIFIWDFISFGSGFLNDDQLFFLCADRFVLQIILNKVKLAIEQQINRLKTNSNPKRVGL